MLRESTRARQWSNKMPLNIAMHAFRAFSQRTNEQMLVSRHGCLDYIGQARIVSVPMSSRIVLVVLLCLNMKH